MIISFFTQKGGVGKSTLAIITASYLAYIKKKKVILIDADPQHSSAIVRRTNLANIDIYKEEMEKLSINQDNIYPIISTSVEDALQALIKGKLDADYVIIDLPGNLQDKILNVVFLSDYVIVPLEHDNASVETSIRSCNTLKTIQAKSKIKDIIAVFNKIPYLQRNKVKTFSSIIRQLDIKVLDNYIGRCDDASNNQIRNTILPPSNERLSQVGEKLNLGGYLSELYDLISKV